jgi:hypothetical protein
MKAKIFSRIQILALLTLPLALTASAFAQNAPSQPGNLGFTVNPTSLDFGTVEVSQTKKVPVEIRNTSSVPIGVFARAAVSNETANDGFTLKSSLKSGLNFDFVSIKAGEAKTIFVTCTNVGSNSTTTRPFTFSQNQQQQPPAIIIPSVCKGSFPAKELSGPQIEGPSGVFTPKPVDIKIPTVGK